MADVALPSLTELAAMGGMDYGAYEQAQNQIGLGMNFAKQNLARGGEELKAAGLKNMFDEQANPLKVNQLGLQNEGMGYENTVKGVKARTDSELEGENKAAKRAELLKSASEDDLKRLQATAQAEMMDPDPTVAERGKRKMDASYEEQTRRRKAADDLAKTNAIVGSREKVAATNAGARSSSDQLKADTAVRIAQMRSADNQAKMAAVMNKPPKDLEGELTLAYRQLAQETDPDKRDELLEYVQGVNSILTGIKQASTAPGIDTAAVANLPKRGVPAVQMPPVIPGQAPRPAVPQPVPQGQARGGSEAQALSGAMDQVNNMSPQEAEGAYNEVQRALKTAKPEERGPMQQYAEHLKSRMTASKQPAAAPVKATKEGYTVIYKNGVPAQVPNANLEKALAQGYTLK